DAAEASKLGLIQPPGETGPVDVTLEAYADRQQRPISPLIYGTAFPAEPAQQRWGLVRSGGNRLTAYNWENNASNAGSDWQYQNDSVVHTSDVPALPLLSAIDIGISTNATTLITLSLADYVAADKNGGGDVRNSGPNYLATRFKRNHAKKPTPFAETPDVTDADVYQDELVAFLRKNRPHAKIIFSMDNEPDLWAHTHAEIFPKPVTYADLWKRNLEFAKAAKEAWPGVEVLGFVSYGYQGYVSLQNAPDNGGRNFLDWYLEQARAAEKQEGKRLIDYLDLHWYPEAQGGGQRIVSDLVTPEVVAARVQAPRSLWDRSYDEVSWVRDAHGGPLKLIPWVQEKIKAHYPGTKLSFSEWNYGGGGHISGGVAVADVLGVFGRWGVDAASYWGTEPFSAAAFRVFRNYDGQGGAFGDISVGTKTTDVASATIYASIDSKDVSRTTLVVINKSPSPKTAGIRLSHSSIYKQAAVYVLAGADPIIQKSASLAPVGTNAFKYDMPPLSVSLIVPQ
ncbi:MAG TPA: glycoside hydrolase family 44 protein, partial [Polyangiales bacterium]